MNMKWLRRLLKPVMDWVGGIKLIRSFPFIVLHYDKNLVKAKEMREIIRLAKPGDLILRRQAKNLATQIIPGFYSHVGVMEDNTHIIHAVEAGVSRDDILDYLVTDYALILRYTGEDASKQRAKAARIAKTCIGKPYDYIFDSDDKRAFYCSEVAMFCYPDIVSERMQKRDKVPPDGLIDVPGFDIIFSSDQWRDET